MTKPRIIALLSALLVALTLQAPGVVRAESKTPKAEQRLNFLVIEADDMRADDIRFMPKTRKLLGKTGLTFHNAFTPNPLCCPSRASFLTGQHSHNHGVLTHEPPFAFQSFDDSITLATQLKSAGYQTGLVGKYLNEYGAQNIHGTKKSSRTYVPPGWTEWWGNTDRPYKGGHTYNYFHPASVVNGALRHWPGRYTTNVTAGQTRALVTKFSARKAPWFLWWTPIAPHHGGPREKDDPPAYKRPDGATGYFVTPARPAYVKGRFNKRIRSGAGVPPGGQPELDMRDKPRYLRLGWPNLSAFEKSALTTVTRQRAEALAVLDDEVAKTIAAVKNAPGADRTIIAFTSDNGYYLGEHRKRQGKTNLHEPSIRVPLLMSGATLPQGSRYDPVTLLDLAVTIAKSAGTNLPKADGIDLSPTFAGDQGWRYPVVLEGLMGQRPYMQSRWTNKDWRRRLNTIGIRLGRYKLVRYSTGEAELYDLKKDPLELDSIHRSAPKLRKQLTNLWEAYASCKRAECTAVLPEKWQLTPADNAAITKAQWQAVVKRYGVR